MTFRGWNKDSIAMRDGRVVEAIAPVIVSASRATDIPAFYSKWFQKRFQEGYVLWTNPFNAKQVQYVSFGSTRVIVFWSKNPKPIMPILSEISDKGIGYYFQYTLNDYEKEGIEGNVASLSQRIDTFKRLADEIGPEKVIWRYDPMVLANGLSVELLLDRVSGIAQQLVPYTRKMVFSFADIETYKKVQRNMLREGVKVHEFSVNQMKEVASGLAERNKSWGLELATCSEKIDLMEYDIRHNKCVDDDLLIRLFPYDVALMNFLGYHPDLFGVGARPSLKDKGQRTECGCIVSKDIGRYDTCHHMCSYCYANSSPVTVKRNVNQHDPLAESL